MSMYLHGYNPLYHDVFDMFLTRVNTDMHFGGISKSIGYMEDPCSV
jgi:hypothetical protein